MTAAINVRVAVPGFVTDVCSALACRVPCQVCTRLLNAVLVRVVSAISGTPLLQARKPGSGTGTVAPSQSGALLDLNPSTTLLGPERTGLL